MLIQNYGLFWLRRKIDWGTKGPGGKGTLYGRLAKHLTDPEVDFREQSGVYILYDDNFRVIYVGQTGSGDQKLFVRIRQHKRDHLAQRWTRFSWFGIQPVKDGVIDQAFKPLRPTVAGVLDHIEAILLAVSEPPLNLQRGKFGKTVDQYVQHVGADEGEFD